MTVASRAVMMAVMTEARTTDVELKEGQSRTSHCGGDGVVGPAVVVSAVIEAVVVMETPLSIDISIDTSSNISTRSWSER